MSLAATKKANELDKDMNAWEENRLVTSGVVRLKEVRHGGGIGRGRGRGGWDRVVGAWEESSLVTPGVVK